MPRTPPQNTPAARRAQQGKGIVRAIYAVTGVVDEVQDLIIPGAFTRTLASRRVKAAWHHDWKEPVGTVLEVEEWMPGDPRFATIPGGVAWPREAGALVATVQYNLRTSRGRDTYEQVRQWHDNGEAAFSIGYKVVTGGASKRHDGVRIIHDLDLYEISPVLHGAHPMTRSLEVKAAASRPGGSDLERKATWSSVELKAAESQAGRGVMIALRLPSDVAAAIAHPEGTAPEELHITLAYLGDVAELGGHPDDLRDIVTPAVLGIPHLKGSIGGLGRFPDHGDGEPTWVPVDVPGLAELRQRIVDTLSTSVYSEQLRTDHGFTPHVTLGYDLPDIPPVPATPVAFTQIDVVRGPDTMFIPLGQPEPTEAAEPAPFEAKSAAQIVLEAARPDDRAVEHKSAAQIVLEAKSSPLPDPETAPMHPMPLSYEQLHTRLAESLRLLWKDGERIDCYVCVEATYADHVIVTKHEDGAASVTYSIPYTVAGRDIDLGVPTEVELTTVAVPVSGETLAVDGDEEIEARYITPTAAALADATALIEVSDAGPSHLQHLKPKIDNLLTALAKKGLPMTDQQQPAPSGSSLDLWDDDYDVTDGWDDDEDMDGSAVPTVPPGNTDEPDTDDDLAAEEDELADQVHLDAEEVKATLATLAL
ncbi:HK97 family phage prohead protease [Streptomyces tirandamycinicus]|uniref:HK97 family phage prohead protease n=1 Tax=Streptomyces tirandamycinicus TaxID=2174846 RepID=UPI00142DD026|nr:HK97 family phage prohead protease [Streptomyces tirandamycinicus]